MLRQIVEVLCEFKPKMAVWKKNHLFISAMQRNSQKGQEVWIETGNPDFTEELWWLLWAGGGPEQALDLSQSTSADLHISGV